MASPTVLPGPVTKFTTSFGTPASYRISTNLAAIVGESPEGFSTTVLPVTMDAAVIPAMIARGKFHGGITTPTPRGI